MGSKFTRETDHSALTSIINNTLAASRINRWFLLSQEYNFKIKVYRRKNKYSGRSSDSFGPRREKNEKGNYDRVKCVQAKRGFIFKRGNRAKLKKKYGLKKLMGKDYISFLTS